MMMMKRLEKCTYNPLDVKYIKINFLFKFTQHWKTHHRAMEQCDEMMRSEITMNSHLS